MVPHCLGTALSPTEQTAQTGQVSQGAEVSQHLQEQPLHVGHHSLCLIITAPQILKKYPYLSPSPLCQARMDAERYLREGRGSSLLYEGGSTAPPGQTTFRITFYFSITACGNTSCVDRELWASVIHSKSQVVHMSCTDLGHIFIMCLFQQCCIHLTPQALAEELSGAAEEDSNACSVERSVARAKLPSSTE